MASDPVAVAAGAAAVPAAREAAPAWRRTFRTGVVTLLAAAITPFIVPLPHARAAFLRARDAVERSRRKEQR